MPLDRDLCISGRPVTPERSNGSQSTSKAGASEGPPDNLPGSLARMLICKERGNSGESDDSLIGELWALFTYGLYLSVLNEI